LTENSFDTLTVPTRTHGDLHVWREAEGLVNIYCAEGHTALGEALQGFGPTVEAAVDSVLHELASKNASDAPKPIVAYGRTEDKVKRFVDVYGGPPPLRPLADFEVRGSMTGRAQVRPPALPELPVAFIGALGVGARLMAIKEARTEFNWPLVDSKRFTDWVYGAYERIRTAERCKEEQDASRRAEEFQAASAPDGTVIRINGRPGGPNHEGWLLEKISQDAWHTTSLLTTYTDANVQSSVDQHGCVILEAGE
jgi:hypothetical protein